MSGTDGYVKLNPTGLRGLFKTLLGQIGFKAIEDNDRKLRCKLSLAAGMIGVSLLFSGCADEFVTEQMPLQQEILLSGSIKQQNITRASDAGFAGGDRMGVYIVDYQNGQPGTLAVNGNRANNHALTFNIVANRWEGNGAIYWKNNQTPIDIYGYYPYDNAMESMTEHIFSVQADQSTKGGDGEMSGYEKSDFLWAKKTNVQPTTELIYLTFEHRLAGIKVVLQQGDGFVGEEWNKLKRIVTVENTALSARINMNTGVATPSEADGKSIIAAPQGDETYRAVTIPQTVSGGKALIGITLDGTSYKYVREETTKLQQGKLHTFTLKIDKKEGGNYSLNLVSEEIEAWENDNSSHHFEAIAYTIINCPEEGTLKACIAKTGKNPQEITNLKIIGKLKDVDFEYIRTSLSQLRALNIYETTTFGDFEVKKEEPLANFRRYRENVLPDDALNGMSDLNHLILPKQLETIGYGSLEGIGLAHNSTLVIPSEVRVLGPRSLIFIEQGNLILPDSLEYIGDGAFYDNQCAFESPLSNRIWYLGYEAFRNKSHSFGHFRLPEFLKHFGEHCFADYGENLEGEINIPTSITDVPAEAFDNMNFSNGTNLTFHNKVVRIGAGAFCGILFNNKITWPTGLVSIGEMAFSYCNFRGGIETFPDELSYIGGGAFYYSKNLPEDLHLPLHLSRVSENAFYSTNIRIANISGYTETIEANAFGNCGHLTTVKIGKYVESIGNNAFRGCRALKNITCLNPEPPTLGSDAFDMCDMDQLILEVPEQSVNKYRSALGWRDFKYITAYHELAVSVGHISCLDKGISRNMVVQSEGEWEVTECPSWCHLSQTSSNVHTTEISIRVDASCSPREGEIVFSLKQSGYQTTCRVSQYMASEAEDKEIVLQQATEGNRAIPLFIVGEGFTAQQIAEGTYLETMKKRMEEFFAIEPYKTYRNYFTVTTALAVSPEEGVGSAQTPILNKFNTTYGENYLCDYNVLRQYVKNVSNIISDTNLGNALILVAMNQNTFGGNTAIFDDGLTISFIPESPYDYPYNTRGLVQHYAGGAGFGRLANEDVSHQDFIKACTCSLCNRINEYYAGRSKGWYGNISLSASKNSVPWSHLIFDPHYSDIVDIYEGGYYHARGTFRSESQSCMNTFIQYYNTISRELIVRRIMELAGETYSFEKFVSKDSREGLPQSNRK